MSGSSSSVLTVEICICIAEQDKPTPKSKAADDANAKHGHVSERQTKRKPIPDKKDNDLHPSEEEHPADTQLLG